MVSFWRLTPLNVCRRHRSFRIRGAMQCAHRHKPRSWHACHRSPVAAKWPLGAALERSRCSSYANNEQPRYKLMAWQVRKKLGHQVH